MQVLIVGDIHGNLEAFQSVLEDARKAGGVGEVWCLGDTVGYGPDPGPCLELLQGPGHCTVAGNHDRAAVGLLDLDAFNPAAAEACRWTAQQLTAAQRGFLRELPLVTRTGDFTLVHGSLQDPVWEYLLTEEAALATFQRLETRYCLVSHSHLPFLCRRQGEGAWFERLTVGSAVSLGDGPIILNPGSVGQPRDGDPRAAYVLCDPEAGTAELRRVPYAIEKTQEKMARAGLPSWLIARLSVGR
ncbi:MAG: metallophosphoesterase family protein [Chloroflexi bacterium]|nr:metallophosphoesterase family protein [Chloroflexota bacterium]